MGSGNNAVLPRCETPRPANPRAAGYPAGLPLDRVNEIQLPQNQQMQFRSPRTKPRTADAGPRRGVEINGSGNKCRAPAMRNVHGSAEITNHSKIITPLGVRTDFPP